MSLQRKFFAGAVVADQTLGSRQIRVVASDSTVDRDKDVMVPEGCVLANYLKNPIVLADHDPAKPIGTAAAAIQNGRVEALITFAPEGISPRADEYCGLAKAGVLSTVSVGFLPIEDEPIKGGGVRIKSWELMEISIVAVPSNPSAVVIGRSFDMGEKAEASDWKVGASRNLPVIGETSAWDPAQAAERIFEKAGFNGDRPDPAWARKAFLFYDAANPRLKSSYRVPIADVISGRLVVSMDAISQAVDAADPDVIISAEIGKSARAVLDQYEARMADAGEPVAKPKTAPKAKIKGLGEVAQLAYALERLGWIEDMAEWEAECEGDGSKVPAMLTECLRSLGAALVAMTIEEVGELLEEEAEPESSALSDEDAAYVASAATPFTKALRQIRAKSRRRIEAPDEKPAAGDKAAEAARAKRLRERDKLRLMAA